MTGRDREIWEQVRGSVTETSKMSDEEWEFWQSYFDRRTIRHAVGMYFQSIDVDCTPNPDYCDLICIKGTRYVLVSDANVVYREVSLLVLEPIPIEECPKQIMKLMNS